MENYYFFYIGEQLKSWFKFSPSVTAFTDDTSNMKMTYLFSVGHFKEL